MIIELLKALLIGIVEGITEWLPISSTGHMILVDEFVHLNVSPEFLKMFLVVIQLGAIMAVILLYFNKLNPFARSKDSAQKRETWNIWGKVIVATIPAGIAGLLLDDWVGEHFYGWLTVSLALIIYGVVFILIERNNRRRLARLTQLRGSDIDPDSIARIRDFEHLDYKTALYIGLFECLAIIPGTSRSGSTIIGAMLLGVSRTIATEFAFFLAIPIMFGWSVLKIIKYGFAWTGMEYAILAVGVITAFVVSILAIKFLIGYIKRNDFTAFGWYRIGLGAIVIAYFAIGMLV
ncbi:MAG: undecaprenyl-diphosphate phosphatase [Coriobacteriales bacterium]|nr:undecaprenyl-diphosphate phosphatase [Coriobacteriales bacterium]